MAKKQIYNSTQGLACGNWKCQNEAAQQEDVAAERLATIKDPEVRDQQARGYVRCNFHVGAEKRRIYSGRKYVPLTDEVREWALADVRRQEAAEKAEKARQINENEQRAIARARREWKQLDEEP